MADNASRARVFGRKGFAHCQHCKGAMMAHDLRPDQAGASFGQQSKFYKGRLEGRAVRSNDVVAMHEHGHSNADREAIDARNDRLFRHDDAFEKVKDRVGFALARHCQFEKIANVIARGKGTGNTEDQCAANSVIAGCGTQGYLLAIDRVARLVAATN